VSGGATIQLQRVPLAAEDGPRAGSVVVVSLAREEAANSFNAALIGELTAALMGLAKDDDARVIVLRGKGKHFSAGADLNWMRAAATLTHAENLEDALLLTQLYEALANLPQPTVGVAFGSTMGGGVGLLAACDVVVADAAARFSLSEVRLGILPAVIMPYVARKLAPGSLRRLMLTGRIFGADEAEHVGLVARIAAAGTLATAVLEEVDALLAAAPTAQAAIKRLHSHLMRNGLAQGPYTAEAIAAARVSQAGQAGLAAFFAKTKAPWTARADVAAWMRVFGATAGGAVV
jgi:methylglutaconyl-CoA hydratase